VKKFNNEHKTLAAFVVTAFFIGGATAQTTQPTTNLEPVLLQTDPVPVQSGEDAEINFKVRNTGNTAAQNVEVNIKDSFPFRLKPDRKRTYELGKVNPGEEYYITAEVLVAQDAPDGQNDLKIETNGGNSFSVTRNVPINVQNSDVELNLANLKTSPSSLMPDTDDNKITVELANNGDKTAENVVLNLDLPSAFEQTSSFSSRQALGNIPAGEIKSATFNFDIAEKAPNGEIEIPTEVSYSAGEQTGRTTKELHFSTFLEGKPQFELNQVNSSLRVGGSGKIEMTVTNIGSVESGSTRVTLVDSSDLPFSFDSSSQYIGTLQSGRSGKAVFDVDVDSDAVSKDYLLDFEIRGVKDTEVFVEDKTVRTEVVERQQRSSSALLVPIIGVVLVLIGSIYYFRDRLKQL